MRELSSQISAAAAAPAVKSLQLCPTLRNPTDGSPPGSSVLGTLQARTLEWVAISFSNAWKWKVKVKLLSCVRLLATPRTAAYQALPSMGFSRQEYWSGLPLPSSANLSNNIIINKNIISISCVILVSLGSVFLCPSSVLFDGIFYKPCCYFVLFIDKYEGFN